MKCTNVGGNCCLDLVLGFMFIAFLKGRFVFYLDIIKQCAITVVSLTNRVAVLK
jgi:hypothetical protein